MRGGAYLRLIVAAPLLLVMLTACQTKDAFVASPGSAAVSGNWKIESQTDRVTGKPISSAFVMTSASNSIASQPRPAQLQLMCFDGRPIVRFAFEFKIGAERNTELGYRIDERPGHDNVETRILTTHTVAVIDEPAAVATFVGELAASRVLYVRLRSLTAGRTAAEFKTEGAQRAIDDAFAGCPLGNAKPNGARAA